MMSRGNHPHIAVFCEMRAVNKMSEHVLSHILMKFSSWRNFIATSLLYVTGMIRKRGTVAIPKQPNFKVSFL